MFLHSREGLTQGYPIEMVAYGICIPPLIKTPKRELPDITQTWYAYNAGALVTFARIHAYFHLLTHQGPICRY